MHKSFVMMDLCLNNGWKAEVNPDTSGEVVVWKLYAIRQQETLMVTYEGNKLIRGDYTYGTGYVLKLNWKNQITKLITGKPDPTKLRRSGGETTMESYVPWTPESTDDEILKAVRGCTISWVRSLDKELVSAQVPVDRDNKHIKLSRPKSNPAQRNLEWADPFGFHAVRIDSIIQVS